jgi:hypothetical protein
VSQGLAEQALLIERGNDDGDFHSPECARLAPSIQRGNDRKPFVRFIPFTMQRRTPAPGTVSSPSPSLDSLR